MSKTASDDNTRIIQTQKNSLKSVTYSIFSLTMLGVLILTIVTIVQVNKFIKNELSLRITDVVNIMATKIDGDLHNQVQTIFDNESTAFVKLKNDLLIA